MKTTGIGIRGLALIMGVLSLIPLALVVPRYVHAAVAPAQTCATTGTYAVGSGSATGTIPGAKTPQIIPIGSSLSGTLAVTAYTGCGTPTSGQFQVHAVRVVGPLPGTNSSSGATRNTAGAAIGIPLSGTTVVSATGTFQQDPAHSADSGYVLVSATVRYGQIGFRCIGVCTNTGSHSSIACAEPPCPNTGAITSRVVSFHDITAYLRVQTGKPDMLGIMFLPPPDPNISSVAGALSPQPVTFWGAKMS